MQPAGREHRALQQALKVSSVNALCAASFLKLATKCGYIRTLESDDNYLDSSQSYQTFPSSATTSGIAMLIASGHFHVFTSAAPSAATMCASGEIRCDLVEPLCAVLLLYPDCFVVSGVQTPTGGGDLAVSSVMDDLLEFQQSQSNSMDVTTPRPRDPCAPSLNVAATLEELRAQRDELALRLIVDIDEQIRFGSVHLLALQHMRTTQPKTVCTVTGPAAHPNLGEGVVISIQLKVARLHLWKILLIACVSHSAVGSLQQPSSSSVMLDVLNAILDQGWEDKPLRNWGWTSLSVAERRYDEISETFQNQFRNNKAAFSFISSFMVRQSVAVAGVMASSNIVIGAPWPSLMAPQLPIEMRDLHFLGCDTTLLFDNTVAATLALNALTQRKLTPSQATPFVDLIQSTLNPNDRAGPTTHKDNMRRLLVKQFLSDHAKLLAIAERNKDIFVLIFRESMKLPAGKVATAVRSCIPHMAAGEPSFHIVRALHDNQLIDDSELSAFVERVVADVNVCSSSGANMIDAATNTDAQLRVQRIITLLTLMLQNMCLSNKRVVLTSDVESVVIGFCMEYSKVKSCTELYGTLVSLRGKR